MNTFTDAFQTGLANYRKVTEGKAALADLLARLTTDLQTASDGKLRLVIESGLDHRCPDRDVLVIHHGPHRLVFASYKPHPEYGFPLDISKGSQPNITPIADVESLELWLQDLLKEPATGRLFSQLMALDSLPPEPIVIPAEITWQTFWIVGHPDPMVSPQRWAAFKKAQIKPMVTDLYDFRRKAGDPSYVFGELYTGGETLGEFFDRFGMERP
jgi:hypothetical protein